MLCLGGDVGNRVVFIFDRGDKEKGLIVACDTNFLPCLGNSAA